MGKVDSWGTVNSFYDLYIDGLYIYQVCFCYCYSLRALLHSVFTCSLWKRFRLQNVRSSRMWDLEGGEAHWREAPGCRWGPVRLGRALLVSPAPLLLGVSSEEMHK